MKKSLLVLSIFFLALQANAQNYNLLVGTYTNKSNSEGIYVYDYNNLTAETKLKSITKNVTNPSYLALTKNNQFVYSVNESGKNSGVSAFAYHSKSGELTPLNQKPSEGADPCYITADEKNVIIANYSGGNLVVFGRNADGSLTDAKQIIQHTGKSIDPKGRQASAHVHMVKFTPDKKHLICNDLGEDRIYIYSYNANAKTPLSIKNVYKTTPGSGPRHITFNPNGKFAYLAHEYNGSITAFTYKNGSLNKIQEISTIAKDFNGKIDAADIHVSADGKFLYETNRGDVNTINVFSILSTGILKPVESVSTLGKGPRNFTIDPSGNFLLVAHQYTNNVVIFNRNSITGKLIDSGKRIEVGSPVCLVFSKQ